MRSFKLLVFFLLSFFSTTSLVLAADANPIRVQVDLSTQSIVQGVQALADQINNNTDSFLEQIAKSLPKIGPGIEALGYAYGNAMMPIRNQILKGLAGGTAIVATGALIKNLGTKYITQYMFEPALIAKRSQKSIVNCITERFQGNHKPVDLTDHMVISEQLRADLNFVMAMTTNIKMHGGQFDNILLIGAPGTGKTLFAQLLAEQCGMDYAIIPAANVSQFLANGKAVEELNNLFTWAASSKNGTIIFFDEAETFLADRSTLTCAAQNALGIFLAQTGTPSNKIMIMCATNRPEILDDAVCSRFGININFQLPDQSARYNQLLMHIKKTFGVQSGSQVTYEILKDDLYVTGLAQRTEGWSGRTIQKFVNRLRQQALAQDTLVITPTVVDQVIEQVQNSIKSQNH